MVYRDLPMKFKAVPHFLFFLASSLSVGGWTVSQVCFADLKTIEAWMKPIDPAFTTHSLESRGFVQVPLDYDHPNVASINIAYRLLPVMTIQDSQAVYFHPKSAQAQSKPLLMVINGGPGASSSHLRRLSFEYDSEIPTDRMAELSKYFRVLMVDQRGTDGQSSSINFLDPSIDAQLITDHFGPRPVALDHARVIQAINPSREPFYIIAQSYGGIVGANYLVELGRRLDVPKPSGVAFTSAGIQSAADAFQKQIRRRLTQRELQRQLIETYPQMESLIESLRERVRSVDPNSTVVDSMATTLGRGSDWKSEFLKKIQSMLAMNDDELSKEIQGEHATIDLLNHILSSAVITPGYTDRTLYTAIKDKMALEDWMLDELRNYHFGRAELDWQNSFLDEVDLHPPMTPKMATMDDIKFAIDQNKVIFTGSVDDPLIPVVETRQLFERLASQNTGYLEFEKGGHGAAFVAPNCARIFERLIN